MPKVSVIIPVYGVEKYIERCARSLFEQTLDDIQYIFVDDCTNDNSIVILESVIKDYPHRKLQIIILKHDYNKGLPIARQTGLKVANGQYIAHCDSDDWVDVNMYKQMYDKAVESNADVVVCDYNSVYPNFMKRHRGSRTKDIDKFFNDILILRCTWAVWNKIVKKDIYNGYYIFPEYAMGEDMLLVSELVSKSKSFDYISTPLYYYTINPTSIVRQKDEKSILKNIEQNQDNLNKLESYLKHEGIEKEDCIEVIKMRIRNLLNPLISNKEYSMLWNNIYPEINRRLIFNKHLTIREKIGFYKRLLFKK